MISRLTYEYRTAPKLKHCILMTSAAQLQIDYEQPVIDNLHYSAIAGYFDSQPTMIDCQRR
jgi:hypothetical protein